MTGTQEVSQTQREQQADFQQTRRHKKVNILKSQAHRNVVVLVEIYFLKIHSLTDIQQSDRQITTHISKVSMGEERKE